MSEPLSPQHQRWRQRVLVSTFFGYAGYYLTRKLFGITKKPIAESLGWKLADTAHVWTAFLVAYMIGQFVNGWLGRKWGPRVLLLGGLGTSILCNALLGCSNSYQHFLILMFLNGLVQASGWPGALGSLSAWLRPEERGRYIGVWASSYMLGNLAVKYVGALTLAYFGWRYSFLGFSGATALIWLLLYAWQRNSPEQVGLEPLVEEDVPAGSSARADYLSQLTNPLVLLMGVSFFCLKFLRYALDSWLPSFLALKFEISASQAASYSGIFDFAGLLGAACAGWLLDRTFAGNWARLTLVLSLGMAAGYGLVLVYGDTPLKVALGCGLIGFMLYGPDMLLSGAGAVEVGGARNGIAVAGIVNGMGSLGPIVQEEAIGRLLRAHPENGIGAYNQLALGVSLLFTLLSAALVLLKKPGASTDATRSAGDG
ncbi:MAG: MFS transporter [Vulcanimicrobiota bacterium]